MLKCFLHPILSIFFKTSLSHYIVWPIYSHSLLFIFANEQFRYSDTLELACIKHVPKTWWHIYISAFEMLVKEQLDTSWPWTRMLQICVVSLAPSHLTWSAMSCSAVNVALCIEVYVPLNNKCCYFVLWAVLVTGEQVWRLEKCILSAFNIWPCIVSSKDSDIICI